MRYSEQGQHEESKQALASPVPMLTDEMEGTKRQQDRQNLNLNRYTNDQEAVSLSRGMGYYRGHMWTVPSFR